MIKRNKWVMGLVILCMIITLSVTVEGSTKIQLTVSAASSLIDVLTELRTLYTRENKNIAIEYNFGATGTLQTQIEQGAPVDVFAGADYESLLKLADEGLMDKTGIQIMAGNTLALVAAKNANLDSRNGFQSLLSPAIRRIAIGNPAYVPAGKYAVTLLNKLGIMNAVQNKLLFATNVRQALAWVETGSVDAAIVYSTDAKLCRSSTLVTETTPNDPIRIRYGIGVLESSKDRYNANRFIKFVVSHRDIWRKYGFTSGE